MKRVWFWGALVLIGAAWAMNLAFYEKSQLKEPIVLNHYIELPMDQTHFFSIYYLTNKKNPAILQTLEVNGLSIPNIAQSNDMWLYGNENSIYNAPDIVQEFSHHILLEAHFDPSMLTPEGIEDKPFTWTDVFLTFSDGTARTFDIGEIHMTESEIQKKPILMSMSGGGSSNGLHSEIFVADQQLKMNEFILPDYIEQDVSVKVQYDEKNGQVTDAFNQAGVMPTWDSLDGVLANEIEWPIVLGQQNTVGIYLKIDPSNSKAIDASVKWIGETIDGEVVYTLVWVGHRPQLTDEDLRKLIKKAGNES